MTEHGLQDRGDAAVGRLTEADATWVEGAAPPNAESGVLVLGDDANAGHWRLNELAVGARFAHGGRVYVAGLVNGAPAVRSTGEVLGRVAQTFIRRSDTMVYLVVAGPAGEERISGTPEHPFWVEALGDWVPLGELQVGTVLTAEGGGTRVVRSLAWREGSFEVFNFEVEGVHDYFVPPAGWENWGGVLVHNSCKVADFIVNERGDLMPTSQKQLVDDLVAAGATKIPGPRGGDGVVYRLDTAPGGATDYRIMDGKPGGGANSGPRTVTTRAGTNEGVFPDGTKPSTPGTPGGPSKDEVRGAMHTHGQVHDR